MTNTIVYSILICLIVLNFRIDDLGKYLIKILIFIPNIIIDVDRLYAFMMTLLILAISAFGIIKFRRLRGLGILVLVSEFGLFSRIDDSKINILAAVIFFMCSFAAVFLVIPNNRLSHFIETLDNKMVLRGLMWS